MDAPDPYRPPRADVNLDPGTAGTTAMTAPLYTLGQITAAAILGSPLAGAILIAGNFRALGKPATRTKALVWGVVGTAVMLVAGLLLPERVPNSFLPILATLALRAAAQQVLGPALAAHAKASGPYQSNWRVVGIALACFAGLAVVAMGGVVVHTYLTNTDVTGE